MQSVGAEIVEGDLASLADVQAAAEGREVILHLGAAFQAGGPFTPDQYMQTNVMGTFNVLQASLELGDQLKHVIATSTDATMDKYPPNGIDDPIAEGIRQRQAWVESKRGEKGDRLRDFRRGVIERAMAEAPDEWSDELKAVIKRAGWDLQEFSESIRQRQAAGNTVTDFSQILIDLATSVEETSWGQVKKEVKEVDEDK
jgi:hypothetical protein